MLKIFKAILVPCFIFTVFIATGCSTMKAHTIGEAHDEVLIFDSAYDLVFLRAMQSVDSIDDWQVEITDKEEGLIRFHNLSFSAFSDADERTITVFIKRISRSQTSVELAPFSQQVIDASKILAAIDSSVKK